MHIYSKYHFSGKNLRHSLLQKQMFSRKDAIGFEERIYPYLNLPSKGTEPFRSLS